VVKSLALLIAVGVAGFLGYPLINEDSGSECDAFERLAVRTILGADSPDESRPGLLLGQWLQGLSKGQLANTIAKAQYPTVPVSVACTMLYWRATTDPRIITQTGSGHR
jgi:hypothetical protein